MYRCNCLVFSLLFSPSSAPDFHRFSFIRRQFSKPFSHMRTRLSLVVIHPNPIINRPPYIRSLLHTTYHVVFTTNILVLPGLVELVTPRHYVLISPGLIQLALSVPPSLVWTSSRRVFVCLFFFFIHYVAQTCTRSTRTLLVNLLLSFGIN